MNAIHSGFRSYHPLPCFMYYAAVTLLSMLLLHPVFLGTAALMLAIINVLYDSPRKVLPLMLGYLGFALLFGMINPLFSHRGAHVLLEVGDERITLEAVLYGLTMALSPLAILYAFISYNRIVSHDRFLYLFGSLWPKGALIVVMAMRFVPLLRRRLRDITRLQRTKGISASQGALSRRVRGGMQLLQILLTWSLEDALQTADSMKARGFGRGPRSSYMPYRLRPRDWGLLAWIILLSLLPAAGRVYGWGLLTIYPRLEPLSLAGGERFSYLAFILLLGIPIAIEGKEWLRSR